VQTLRAAGDTIAMATAAEVLCFDAASGKPLWKHFIKEKGWRLLVATPDVMVIAYNDQVVVRSHKGSEIFAIRAPKGAVDARISGDRLVLAEPGRASVVALASGEEEWHAKASGEVVISGDRVLVPGGGHTSHVYSLQDKAAKKVKTDAALGRPSSPSVRVVDGTLVAVVTGTGAIVLVDVLDAVEAHRTTPAPSRGIQAAWLAGSFLIATAPLSVSNLWGGVATPIPLVPSAAPGAVLVGPAQAIVRGADGNSWLEFS
jgi:outer membrane protein assembly factor BamB